jgi:formylglycine-generating enzyme required for sulfatase activity
MGKNPSYFVRGDHKMEVVKNGKSIRLQPNNPVETVSYWSVLEFANRLSRRKGLPEVYDMSAIKFRPGTSAEEGNLVPKDDQYFKLKIKAPDGDIYKAKGFRLPTDAEQEYLRSDRGRSTTEYFSGVTESNLQEFAHFYSRETVPVAEHKATVIDGKSFFDFYGNVYEMENDFYKLSDYPSGTDPIKTAIGKAVCARGGGFSSSPSQSKAADRRDANSGSGTLDTGFRLVRTLE